MITNEIQFLRELSQCDNFIQLESVHRDEENIYLVLKYAEHGCLRSLLINKMTDKLSEE